MNLPLLALSILLPVADFTQGATPQVGASAGLSWPSFFSSNVVKLVAGPLFAPGADQLLVLTDTELVLVDSGISAPRMVGLLEGVRDVCVLPPVGGLSRVAIVDEGGLGIGTVVQTSSGPTLEFSSRLSDVGWRTAQRIDAAADGTVTTIFGVENELVVRASLAAGSSSPSALPGYVLGAVVEHFSAANASTHAGVELAIATGASVQFLQSNGTPYHALSLAGTCREVRRIPAGADARDSFGMLVDHGGYDSLIEVAGTVAALPLYGGAVRFRSLAFGHAGTSFLSKGMPRVDLFAMTADDKVFVLHGEPQGSVEPFRFDFGAWWFTSIDESLGSCPPVAPLHLAADFDGDGDDDLALAGSCDNELKLLIVANEHAVSNPSLPESVLEQPSFVSVANGTGPSYLGLQAQVTVRRPASFVSAQPTHVNVRAYLRPYSVSPSGPQPALLPDIWFESTLPVTPVSSTLFAAAVDIPLRRLPSGLDASNTLVFVELVPQLWSGSTLVRRAAATNWVGSDNALLLSQLICIDEFDEFSGEYCYNGGQLITEVHRRRVLREIPPTPTGQ